MKTSLYVIGLLTVLSLTAMPLLAASFKLEATGNEPLYQSTLLKEVYQYGRSDHLQDLTITNAVGEQVPYALLPYEDLHPHNTTTHDSKPLSVYPIHESQLKNPSELSVQLENLEKYAVTPSLTLQINSQVKDAKTIYLVDAGKKHPALQTLSVDWLGGEDTLLSLDILASEDLKNWSNAGHAVLLKTSTEGKTLLQNNITLGSPTEARYLQIRPSESYPLILTKINAEYSSTQPLTPEIIWQEIPLLQREQDDKRGVINLDFESLGRYPAGYLRINLPQINTITSARVFVRNKSDTPWQYLTTSSLYRIDKSGKSYTNPDILVNAKASRFWRLQFNQANGGLGKENPNLSLGWLPQTAVWNARGPAPFSIQVGENQKIINSVVIASLIPDYKIEKILLLPKANIVLAASTENNTGTETLQTNAWTSPPDYKRWLLWGGLLLGVLLLAGMVYSLLKTNNKE